MAKKPLAVRWHGVAPRLCPACSRDIEIDHLRARVAELEAERDNLRTFARWVLRGYDGGEIGNIDGGELQDEAVRLGLLVPASKCDGDCDGECTCLTLADVLNEAP